jgi:SAM-dependent methyltransferase
MNRDRVKWNEKYGRGDHPVEPSEIVRAFSRLAVHGRALDVAAGSGRNAAFLAGQGFAVDAVDISDGGLALFAGLHPNIRCLCADLDTWEIPSRRYELIVNTLYLNRRLFPQISDGLKPGGVLVFESLLEGLAGAGEAETCRDYLLRPNELLHAFLRLRVIHYSESWGSARPGSKSTAALVAVKP